MALTSCFECKKEISDRAKQCPHCGVPISKIPISDVIWGSIIMFVIGSFLWGYITG